jgi:hypothetical protein
LGATVEPQCQLVPGTTENGAMACNRRLKIYWSAVAGGTHTCNHQHLQPEDPWRDCEGGFADLPDAKQQKI